jgi:hypothetical protein
MMPAESGGGIFRLEHGDGEGDGSMPLCSLLSAEKKLLLFSGWTADRYPVLSMSTMVRPAGKGRLLQC